MANKEFSSYIRPSFSDFVYCSHCKQYRYLFGSFYDSNVRRRIGYRKNDGSFYTYSSESMQPYRDIEKRKYVELIYCGLCGHLIKIEDAFPWVNNND